MKKFNYLVFLAGFIGTGCATSLVHNPTESDLTAQLGKQVRIESYQPALCNPSATCNNTGISSKIIFENGYKLVRHDGSVAAIFTGSPRNDSGATLAHNLN